jgi:tRNA G18 (ribose-2'-O)-methylase SpoU
MRRGYFGIGIVAGKSPENIGGLWRSAHALGAAFIFTVGHRYPKQPSDTTKAWRHVPLFEYEGVDHLLASMPRDCEVIGVECPAKRPLTSYRHPERAIYLLGAEDRGLPAHAISACRTTVEIPSTHCLNVATAGSILLYDRLAKAA